MQRYNIFLLINKIIINFNINEKYHSVWKVQYSFCSQFKVFDKGNNVRDSLAFEDNNDLLKSVNFFI